MDILVALLFLVGTSALLVGALLAIRIFWGLGVDALHDLRRGPDSIKRRRTLLALWLLVAWMILLVILVIVFEITKPFGEDSGFIPVLVGIGVSAVGIFAVGLVGAIQGIRRGRRERQADRPGPSGS